MLPQVAHEMSPSLLGAAERVGRRFLLVDFSVTPGLVQQPCEPDTCEAQWVLQLHMLRPRRFNDELVWPSLQLEQPAVPFTFHN